MSTSQNRSKSAWPQLSQIAPTASIVFLGVILSLVLFWAAYSWEMHSIRRDFDELADTRCKEVSNAFQETAKLIDFTDNVFMIAPRVGTHAFAEYLYSLKKLLDEDRSRHPEIHSLIWVPRVSRSERTAYEQSAKTAFGFNLQIGNPADTGNTGQAAQTVENYPIYLRITEKSDHDPLGVDLARDPAMWEVMKRSRDDGAMLAVAPMKMSTDAGSGLGYRIFQPLYYTGVLGNTQDPRQSNAGFLCLDLDVGKLVDKAINNIDPAGIDVRVSDNTDKNPVIICQYLSRLHSSYAAGDDGVKELESNWTSEFFGRKVLIQCFSTPAFWAGRTIWQPGLVLCGGMALTLIGAGFQFHLTCRERMVEQTVNKRIARLYNEIEQRQHADRAWDPNPSRPEVTSNQELLTK